MSASVDERVDLDVDLDKAVPCDGAYREGCIRPATERCRAQCPACRFGPWFHLCTPCAVEASGWFPRHSLVMLTCRQCGVRAPAFTYKVERRPL